MLSIELRGHIYTQIATRNVQWIYFQLENKIDEARESCLVELGDMLRESRSPFFQINILKIRTFNAGPSLITVQLETGQEGCPG